ncbi:MAG: ABC transporter permease [Oscillospiraceae bacterium]|nr:ABC transporter permease [Oscillospiraceae bacterium]
MHSFLVFLQKEFAEQLRTKRLFILICFFAFFGFAAPVLTRYMQDIINATAGAAAMAFEMPPTTWVDSWAQFYSLFGQLGALGVIMLFMGCISGEKQSGSAALTLTKNISHTSFVMAKFISMAVLLIISFALAVGIAYGYTYFLFGYAGSLAGVLLGATTYGLSLIALLGLIVLSSALTKSSVASAMMAFGAFIFFFVVAQNIPGIHAWMPGTLAGQPLVLLAGEELQLTSVFGALGLTVLCLIGAIHTLKKQEI